MNKLGFVIAAVVLAAVAFVTSAFVVDQRQIGLVYQFGQIQRVISYKADIGLRCRAQQCVRLARHRIFHIDAYPLCRGAVA